MKKTDIDRLRHMLEAAREIRLFIIGEAASKVSQETREQIPGIEWRDVIDMRNILVHAYFEIDEDILWNTITYGIPRLIEELEKLPELRSLG